MSRVAALLVGVSLLVAMLGSGSAPFVEKPRATAETSSVLEKCPSLERGAKDPVDGKNCVREVQIGLKKAGRDQPVTGFFGEITEANVKDFQLSHGIPAIGVVGPQTRKALVGYLSSAAPPVPAVPRSSFSIGQCMDRQCDIFLSRTVTRRSATAVTDHPHHTGAVTSAILGTACKVFKTVVVSLACQLFGNFYAKRLKAALVTASEQNACLRIVLRPPTSLRSPLSFGADNSSRCKD